MTLDNNKLRDTVQELLVLLNNLNERVHVIEDRLGIKPTIEAFRCFACGNQYGTGIDVDTYVCVKCGGRLFEPVMRHE